MTPVPPRGYSSVTYSRKSDPNHDSSVSLEKRLSQELPGAAPEIGLRWSNVTLATELARGSALLECFNLTLRAREKSGIENRPQLVAERVHEGSDSLQGEPSVAVVKPCLR